MIGAPALFVFALVAQAVPSGWSVSAGPERFSFRDISRSGPPADASPVAWEGSGPSLAVAYTREGPRRFHRVNLDIARASSFAYTGPLRSADAEPSDHVLRLEGRYEYRRYFLDDLFTRGLDVGVGVQGIARRLALTRDTTVGGREEADTTAAIACSLAARWHRSPRWSAEVAWVNGGALLHRRESQTGATEFEHAAWGGGWLTDLAVQGAVRLTDPWSLTVAYLRTGEGTATSHNSYAFDRRRLVAGVTYAR
jgi:hypothetical protein